MILPAVIGGQWATDLDVSAPESPYLAFIVGLHVATAAALLVFFWRDWVRIVGGFFSSIRYRRVSTDSERLAWLIILATIPIGLAGLLLEHTFRTVLGRPIPAAAFLIANGVILLVGERLRRRAHDRRRRCAGGRYRTCPDRIGDAGPGRGHRGAGGGPAVGPAARRAVDRRGVLVGASQILALLPGISRSGVAMVAGLTQGLSHRDAARFSFLLATPVILAAGVLKIPDLTGPLGAGIARADPGRQRRLVRLRLPVGPVPGTVLPDPHPDPVRGLLADRGRGSTDLADRRVNHDAPPGHPIAGAGHASHRPSCSAANPSTLRFANFELLGRVAPRRPGRLRHLPAASSWQGWRC